MVDGFDLMPSINATENTALRSREKPLHHSVVSTTAQRAVFHLRLKVRTAVRGT